MVSPYGKNQYGGSNRRHRELLKLHCEMLAREQPKNNYT
jgi:hypothetical protein